MKPRSTPRRHGKTFAEIVAAAHVATPFGRFDRASREGLIRRGIAMGLRRTTAESVIDEYDRRGAAARNARGSER